MRQVKAGTKFSFDYGMLILIASILAGVGLASDNTVVIVASMLVSPMMGPVLAVTLGTSINRWDLVRNGLETGLMTFMEILAVGAILGIICAALPGYDIATYWPTHEMSSRGEPLGLLVGLAIALASGIGVALSGLSENSSSLVGVAISASLLPPCVNTGMCWTYSLFGEQVHGSHVRRTYFFNIGYISLCLTLLNIASIFVTGFLVFRTKASLKFDTYTKDLAAAREYYQTVRLPKPKSKKSPDVDLSSPLPTRKGNARPVASTTQRHTSRFETPAPRPPHPPPTHPNSTNAPTFTSGTVGSHLAAEFGGRRAWCGGRRWCGEPASRAASDHRGHPARAAHSGPLHAAVE